jgi:hypothetical protein
VRYERAYFQYVPVEQVRDYWDRTSCEIRRSMEPAGSREYFDKVEQRKYFVEAHIPGFAEFPLWQNKHVLEFPLLRSTDCARYVFSEPGARTLLAPRRFPLVLKDDYSYEIMPTHLRTD